MRAAIDLSGVTLVRRTQQELHYDLKRTLLNLVRFRGRKVKRHTVLDGVDLRIGHGEKVGVIGPNGSGKSTLLKLIAGVLAPTRGTVGIDGTLSPLIEIGVGFEQELTLVDNVVYYGILLGHDEALVRKHVDGVLDFAELSEIRDQPTKTLSSGMAARLGFAIATEFRPDILLLDEVLSVGDERFRRKCAARIDRFWDANSTIVLVSHDLAYVERTCDRAIWLENGKVVFDGPADRAVQLYLDTVPAVVTFRTGEELIAYATEKGARGLVIRGATKNDQGIRMYLIRDGHRWPIASDGFGKYGFLPEEIINVADPVVHEIPEGNVVL